MTFLLDYKLLSKQGSSKEFALDVHLQKSSLPAGKSVQPLQFCLRDAFKRKKAMEAITYTYMRL